MRHPTARLESKHAAATPMRKGELTRAAILDAALELGKRTPQWGMADPGSFTLGNHTFRDDVPGGHGWVDMFRSIVVSCDTYYYRLANDMGVNAIHDFMKPFGFGQITGIDIEGERTGILPSTDWKRKAYKRPEQQKWYDGETISLGIGQGYNNFTILQLANAMSTLAAKGVKLATGDGRLRVLQQGAVRKLVKRVDQITFSGPTLSPISPPSMTPPAMPPRNRNSINCACCVVSANFSIRKKV